MLIKSKVKTLKITLVIKYLRFGRFGHVTSKIRNLAPLGSRDPNISRQFPQNYISNTAQIRRGCIPPGGGGGVNPPYRWVGFHHRRDVPH